MNILLQWLHYNRVVDTVATLSPCRYSGYNIAMSLQWLEWIHYNYLYRVYNHVVSFATQYPFRYIGYNGYTISMSLQWIHYNHVDTVDTL